MKNLYNSLFHEEDFAHSYHKSMEFRGSFGKNLLDLRGKDKESCRDKRQRIIWGATRIIRGVLDYKIKNESTPSIREKNVSLVEKATNTALEIYSNPDLVEKSTQKFRDFLEDHKSGEIIRMKMSQEIDKVTFACSSPNLTKKSLDFLATELDGEDLLFILAGHGGVPAGMDLFLKYSGIDGWKKGRNLIYPVRFSCQKFSDVIPRLTSEEIEHLKEIKEHRKVLIFDEDTSLGTTLTGMKAFFEEEVFPDEKVVVRANQDVGKVADRLNGTFRVLGGYD